MKTVSTLLSMTVLLVPAPAPAQDAPIRVEIEEWEVPYPDSRPRDPYLAPDGDVWFVGQAADYVAWFDPESEAFGRWPLPRGAGPHNLIVDDQGRIWYAGNRDAHIGVVDPADGSIERIDMPDPAARDPHTLVFNRDGDIWFTLQGSNKVGFLDVERREVTLIDVPTPASRPYGIEVDADNRPWLNLLGTNKLATVDPGSFELTEIKLPRDDARTRRIGITGDGMVWYVDWARGYLGRYAPANGAVTEWRLPGGAESRPYAMAVDAMGRIWAFETGGMPNRLRGFDPETETFFAEGTVPSGAGTVRHMYYDPGANVLWFGTDTNRIGRAHLPGR